jgi:hypothetical protein
MITSENELSEVQTDSYDEELAEGDLFVLQAIRPDLVAAIIGAKQRAARSMCKAGSQRRPTPQDRCRDVLRRS